MIQLGAKLLLFGTTASFAAGLLAAPQYVSSVIEPEEEIAGHSRGDLNGDGLGDLLLGAWTPGRGRELLIYLQQDDGRFPGKPSQRIDIKKDIIAYGLADIRPEAGEELIFLTRNGAYSYSSRKEGYAGNLEKLFNWELLATVPEKTVLPFLGRLEDYTGDGEVDLLLPGRERYGLFSGKDGGGFGEVALLPKPHWDAGQTSGNEVNFNISEENGLTFVVRRNTPFDGLFPEPPPPSPDQSGWDRFGLGDSILEVEQWLPAVRPARLNNDPLADFVFLDQSGASPGKTILRFNAIYQSADGVNSREPDWQGELGPSGEISLGDVNGDGLDDLFALESRGSDEYSLVFFLNRNGRFDFSEADQAMRFSGYEVEAALHDLNGDGRPELIVSYYSLAAVDALRDGSMLRTTLVYGGDDDGGIFTRRPTAKLEEKFSASSVRGLTERMHFSADLTGDARHEALGLDDQGALVARRIDDRLQIDSEVLWRFVPLHLIQAVVPETFNQDSSTDFILEHQNGVTVLVSRS